MKKIKLKRTIREGCVNFYRNGWLSVATVIILATSLFIISMTVLIGITGKFVLKNIEEKVSVAVYFNPDVGEEEIFDIKSKLEKFTEIKSVNYISREQALSELNELEKDNSSIRQALEEIGENPLLASLVINASKTEYYDIISKAIANSNFSDRISRINYEQNKVIIERLANIITLVEKVGLALGVMFVFLAVLITFNTIRITIYSHRQEFEVMRLVGASNIYVEMPFVVEGVLYGISAGFISLAMIFLTAKYISVITYKVIFQGGLMDYYLGHFWIIAGILLVSGMALGVVSSFIAIRKYLKV